MRAIKNKRDSVCYTDIVGAFLDALENYHSPKQLMEITGLPLQRCQDIEEIYLLTENGKISD